MERFDRDHGQRLHVEDFNQALGVAGDAKYQENGGQASLRRVAETVRAACGAAALDRLLLHLCASVVIGNLDMHLKNISLLHFPDGRADLAPAYDMVPMAYRAGENGRHALAVGGEYRHGAISRRQLDDEAASWGLGDAQARVAKALSTIASALRTVDVPSGAGDAANAAQETVTALDA